MISAERFYLPEQVPYRMTTVGYCESLEALKMPYLPGQVSYRMTLFVLEISNHPLYIRLPGRKTNRRSKYGERRAQTARTHSAD